MSLSLPKLGDGEFRALVDRRPPEVDPLARYQRPPMRKREAKEDAKSNLKAWDLMAHVDHEGMQARRSRDCGIRKIWGETKSANPLSVSRISESLVFNSFKQAEYERVMEEHLTTQIYQPPPGIPHSVMIDAFIKVLQGIPSNVFQLDPNTLEF